MSLLTPHPCVCECVCACVLCEGVEVCNNFRALNSSVIYTLSQNTVHHGWMYTYDQMGGSLTRVTVSITVPFCNVRSREVT